jgi:ribonuclease HI
MGIESCELRVASEHGGLRICGRIYSQHATRNTQLATSPHPIYNISVNEIITVNFDGGSRGNPGAAGIGVVLCAQDKTPLVTLGRYIGRATNNIAEYMALIVGLREAGKLGAKKLRGEYRVKNPALKDLHEQAHAIAKGFEEIRFEHNLRQHNSLADRLANLAMDRKEDVTEVSDEGDGSNEPDDEVLACPNCGCRIEVIQPPAGGQDGYFICRCGSAMK